MAGPQVIRERPAQWNVVENDPQIWNVIDSQHRNGGGASW